MGRRPATLGLLATLLLLLALPPGPPAQAKDASSPPGPLSHRGERGSPAASSVLFVENVGQFADGARFRLYWGGPTLWLADDALWVTAEERPARPATALADTRPRPWRTPGHGPGGPGPRPT